MFDFVRPYLTPIFVLPGLFVFYVVYNTTCKVIQNRKIRRLGARAPIRTTYYPYGLDIVYEVVTHMLRDENYELWLKMFDTWGRGGHTVEAGSGERVILTAEPENIKAILATQFKEYGKGEKFRQDWFTFLGNGIFATDGTLWHNSRQLIRPQFIKDRLSDIDIFEEHVKVLIGKLGESSEVEVLDMMFR